MDLFWLKLQTLVPKQDDQGIGLQKTSWVEITVVQDDQAIG